MRVLFIVLLSFFSLFTNGQTWTSKNVSMTGISAGYWEYLPAGYNDIANANKKYPTIVAFHGSGVNGNSYSQINQLLTEGLPKVINDGLFPSSFTVNATNYQFVVICPMESWSGTTANTNDIVNFIKGNYRVDNSRFYLTGMSQGGEVIMKWSSESLANSQKIAAMGVACPSLYSTMAQAGNLGNSNVALWFYHNTGDPVVDVGTSASWVTDVNTYNPTPLAQKTNPVSNSHDAWTVMYDPNTDVTGTYNLYEWMLQYSHPNQADPNNPFRIAVLGSSTTAGTGASPIDSSWVKRLEAYYNRNANDFLDTLVYNLGVSGATTYNAQPLSYTPTGGRPYPDPTKNITYAINSYHPQRIIINFPSNDIGFGYTNAETMANLRRIRDTATLAGAETWVLSTQPRDDFGAGAKADLIVQRDSILTGFFGKAINIFDTLATVDDLGILPAVSAGDGVHVNNTGHRYIFTKVAAGPIGETSGGISGVQHVIPIRQGNVFTISGYNRVDGYRWFDGDINTKFAKVDWTADWRAGDVYPNDNWVVLDSTYNISSYDVYTNYETGLSYSLFFYDASKAQIGDSTSFNSLGNGWRNFVLPKNGVRFVRLKTYSSFASNTGLRDVALNGTTIAAASNIFPTLGSNSYTDVGITANGMNYLGDRFDKLDLQNDTISNKITKAIRWGEIPSDFDYYPDTRNVPLINGPLYLGRYQNDGYAKNFNRLKLRGHHLMMYGTGGTIKNVTDPAEVSNNTSWTGLATGIQSSRYTEAGADPRHDTSWNAKAERIYGLVRLYGSNAAATGGPTIIGGANTAGQNNLDIFETGNEESRWWVQSYYLNPEAYYAFQKTLYNRGKQADPNAKIYAPALPGFDTTYWRAVWWSHYWSGGDVNNFPTDGLNFNMYLNNDKSDQGAGGDTYAISPEKWKVREDMLVLKNFFNRMFPSKQVQWTEFGYATDDVSPYDVNPIGAKTDRYVQAEWTIRLKAIVQSTSFISRMYYYSFYEDATGPFNSMAAAKDSSDWIHVIPQPVGYALGQELKLENNYKWYSTVVSSGDSTANWVTRKDHNTDINKKLYKVWRGTDNGSFGSQVITVTGATSARLYTMRYDQWSPDSSNLTITANQITVPTSEAMSWVEVTTNGATNTPPISAAGSDQAITLPTSQVTLNGSGTDGDGSISNYQWTKLTTGAATITSPTSASTTVTGLAQGIHTFRLTVTDNGSATAFDDVSVNVSAAPASTGDTIYIKDVKKMYVTSGGTRRVNAVVYYFDGTRSQIANKPSSSAYVVGVSKRNKVINGQQRIIAVLSYSDGTSGTVEYKVL